MDIDRAYQQEQAKSGSGMWRVVCQSHGGVYFVEAVTDDEAAETFRRWWVRKPVVETGDKPPALILNIHGISW